MSRPCKRNGPRLVALLSGALGPRAADRLREHLARCPGCAEALERLQKTAALCRELGAEPAPDLPWRQIEAQVQWKLSRAEETPARRRHLGWAPLIAGMSAAALVGVVVGLLVGRGTGRERPQPPVASAGKTQLPPDPIIDEELAAVVTLARGEVSVVSSKGQASDLVASRPLLQGERVITGTGSRVALQWSEGTGVLLGDESELELRVLRSVRQELALQQGRLTFKVQHRRPGQSFAVLSGGVRVSVTGTQFSVATTPATVEVTVQEGRVRVEPDDRGWAPVEVAAGSSLLVRRGGKQRPSVTAAPKQDATALLAQLNLLPWTSFQRVMAGTGLLALESLPDGADVVFDSRGVGSTNLKLRGGLGRHLVELWRGGKLVRRQWVEIQLSPGRLAVDLLPRPAPRPVLPPGVHELFVQRTVQIQGCYERRLKNDPTLSGRLTIRVQIDRSGHVASASLDTDTLTDPRVGQCALSVVRRWEFPAGNAAELVYPFHFKPR